MAKKYLVQHYKKCKVLKEFRAEHTTGQRTYPHVFIKDEVVDLPDYQADRWRKRGYLEIIDDAAQPIQRYGAPCNQEGLNRVWKHERDVYLKDLLG